MRDERRPLVVVTRAAEQSGGLMRRLVDAGYDVLEVPVIAIVEADDGGAALRAALGRLDAFDWVVLTSPNGARRVRAALQARAGAGPRVAVVGPGTATEVGVPVSLVASSSVGEGLVAEFPGGSGRVLLVQAADARPVVREGIASLGWQVDVVTAYRTIPATPEPRLVAAARDAEAIVFTSGSTVRHFVEATGREGIPRVVASIGPVTTAVAGDLGIQVTVTASAHTLDGVVDALETVLRPRPDLAPAPRS